MTSDEDGPLGTWIDYEPEDEARLPPNVKYWTIDGVEYQEMPDGTLAKFELTPEQLEEYRRLLAAER